MQRFCFCATLLIGYMATLKQPKRCHDEVANGRGWAGFAPIPLALFGRMTR